MSIVRIEPQQRLASAVVHGGLVYLSGHVAHDTSGDTRDQTRQVLEAIDAHLAAAGTDRSRLLSVQIWLADIATFPEMNAAWVTRVARRDRRHRGALRRPDAH